jgi:pyruvate/2-oxoglutarate dehydrogenase complex dihydrolipoamide acyltransferase (E2) component
VAGPVPETKTGDGWLAAQADGGTGAPPQATTNNHTTDTPQGREIADGHDEARHPDGKACPHRTTATTAAAAPAAAAPAAAAAPTAAPPAAAPAAAAAATAAPADAATATATAARKALSCRVSAKETESRWQILPHGRCLRVRDLQGALLQPAGAN